MSMWAGAWAEMLARVVDDAHLVTGDRLSIMLADAVRDLGLTADVLMVDLAQEVLTPMSPQGISPVHVDGTIAGRAYQLGEILPANDGPAERLLWVPILDGTERIGVLRVGLDEGVIDDPELRARCWSLAGLMGHIIMTKIVYSDRLRMLRYNMPLSVPSELLWQLLPPRTFASERVVVTALLEPTIRSPGTPTITPRTRPRWTWPCSTPSATTCSLA